MESRGQKWKNPHSSRQFQAEMPFLSGFGRGSGIQNPLSYSTLRIDKLWPPFNKVVQFPGELTKAITFS